MRVHRIVLRNYRGVSFRTLSFAERGVTVVEGDNEAGKSSTAEALRLVLDYRDDSTHRAVKAVKPVQRDVGAEVEVELAVGPYHLVYAKRWHKDRYTTLKVLTPTPQVLTGREAHDRVCELMAEAVDVDLWRALSGPQGDGHRQRGLRDHPSVVAALDAAAGGDAGDGGDDDLLDRATSEAGRWFTPSGRVRAALADVRRRAADAESVVERCRHAIEQVEADVEWCAHLHRTAADLGDKLATAGDEADRAAAHLADVERHRTAVEGLAMASRLAASEISVANGAVLARTTLVAAATAAAHRADGAAARSQSAADEQADAETALAAALDEAASTGTAVERADDASRSATAAYDRLRRLAALAVSEDRLDEAEHHRRALDEALADVAANPSSPEAVAALQAVHDDVVRAEAALEAGRTTVRLHALDDVTVALGGTERHLVAGAVEEQAVVDHIAVEVPGTVVISVTAAASAHRLLDRYREAEAALSEHCATLGVTDLSGAHALEQQRLALTTEIETRRAVLAGILGGDSLEALAVRVRDEQAALGLDPGDQPARDQHAGHEPVGHEPVGHEPVGQEPVGVGRPSDEALAGARARALRAAELRQDAERTAAGAEAKVKLARQRATAAARAVGLAGVEVAATRADLDACLQALSEARAVHTDEKLTMAAGAAQQAGTDAGDAWRSAAAELEALDADSVADAARRAAAERNGIDAALRQVGEDLAGVRSRLELHGEAGLHDRLGEAEEASATAREERDSVEARAAAAQLLLGVLTGHRNEASRAYGAPLRAGIESLGRSLYGDSFSVELDDELQVAARVLDGVPISWDDLSIGTREQLWVLTRLAAATLVNPDGGVPVVFDDVLGFTSPDRLAGVAKAFEAASRHCQIIVFTCDPSRYRHLPRAATHNVSEAGPAGTEREAS